MALIDNLISYWKLDEASGNALDAHGSNDLTDNNTVGTAAGKMGNARDFAAASNEYFSHADNSDFSRGDTDFTFQAWIKVDGPDANGYATILTKWAASNQEYFLGWTATGNKIQWYVSGDGTSATGIDTTTTVSTGTWALIHAWHDSVNNQIAVAINAGTPETLSYSSGIFNGSTQFCIGRNPDDVNGDFDGLIDEVGFWSRVLTSDERTALYNSGNGLAYPFSSGNGAGRLVNSIPLKSMIGGRLAA